MFPHEQKAWLVLYKAALLESDLQKMPVRIVLAGRAIQKRLRELRGSNGHYGEKLEMHYAIRNLKAAEKNEVKPTVEEAKFHCPNRLCPRPFPSSGLRTWIVDVISFRVSS